MKGKERNLVKIKKGKLTWLFFSLISGFLYEKFNSYIMPFSFAGMMYLFSAIFCLTVQCLSHASKRKDSKLEQEIIVT